MNDRVLTYAHLLFLDVSSDDLVNSYTSVCICLYVYACVYTTGDSSRVVTRIVMDSFNLQHFYAFFFTILQHEISSTFRSWHGKFYIANIFSYII